MWRLGVILLFIWAFALASKKQSFELYYAPECVKEVHQLPETYCHGPDNEHLTCPKIGMTIQKDCGVLRVIK